MGSDPIRHHVVPEFYLKRFADADERLMVLRRGNPKPFLAKVNRFALLRNFNTITDEDGNPSYEIERRYKRVEDATAPILRTIAERDGIPVGEPRAILALFMALQSTRTPEFRDLTNLQVEMHAKMLMYGHNDTSLRSMLQAMRGREPTEEEFVEAKQMVANIDGITIEATKEYSLGLAWKLAIEGIMPHLWRERFWYLIRADEPVFITSDHPIVFHRAPGIPIGIETAPIIYFPIDPYRTLMLLKEKKWDYQLLEPHAAAIKDINQLIANEFYEWIAYHPDHEGPLLGIEVAEQGPMMSYNGKEVYGDKRDIGDALAEMRNFIEGIKLSGERRAKESRNNET